MTDTPPPGTPVAEHLSDIARRLKEIEAEREAERAKRRDDEPTTHVDAWGYTA